MLRVHSSRGSSDFGGTYPLSGIQPNRIAVNVVGHFPASRYSRGNCSPNHFDKPYHPVGSKVLIVGWRYRPSETLVELAKIMSRAPMLVAACIRLAVARI